MAQKCMKKIFIISLALLFLASGAQAVVSSETQNGITAKKINQDAGQGVTAGEPTPTKMQAKEAEETEAVQTKIQDEEAVQTRAGQAEPSTTNGQKIQTQTQTQTQDVGEEGGIMLQAQTRAKTVTELKAMIKEQKRVISAEVEQMSNKTKQKILQNQNEVRKTVHALLVSEGLVGGIGKRVSQIAVEFSNSVEKTIEFEEKIQTRGRIKSFFFGGDKESAKALEQEASQNQGKIAELKSLYEDCDCQQEVKEVLAEQIQNLDIEQNRLRQLAKKQLDSKGVFGWLFGWLSK